MEPLLCAGQVDLTEDGVSVVVWVGEQLSHVGVRDADAGC